MKILMRWAAVSVLVGAYLTMMWGCGKREKAEPALPAEVTVGAILPITGPASVLGEFVRAGIIVATADINANGGINGRPLRVIIEDSKNDPKEAINAYRKLIASDKVIAMISSMSGVSSALAPLAESDRKVLFTTTVSASKFAAKSPWVFRLFINADIDAATAARFAREKLNAQTAAILHVEDDMGKSFASVFNTVFRGIGGSVILTEAFGATTLDFKNVAAKLIGLRTDLLYLVGYDKNLGILIKQIREAGVSIPVISIATVGETYVMQQAGSALEGIYFTSTQYDPQNPRSEIAKEFVSKTEAMTGKKPNYFSAFAYDSVLALCSALRDVSDPSDPESVRARLISMPSIDGVVGRISFDKDGDAFFPMIVKQINNGHSVDAQ